MTKYKTALVFLFMASSVDGSQKPKLDKLLPPAESHGMTINGYGCDKDHVADSPSAPRNSSFWALTVWAQYGKDHKKYWRKNYGTFEVPVKTSVNSSGESAASGEAIGAYSTQSYDFTAMDKACADWGEHVKSTLKVEPDAGVPPRTENFAAKSEQPIKASDKSASGTAQTDAGHAAYANTHPYLDWPLAQLTGRIPELQGLQPAPNQEQLPAILQNMGRTVDDFIHNIVDLIAHEDVTQEKLDAKGEIEAKERVQDDYLILHHGDEWGASAEYRMDDKGNRLGPIGLDNGFLATSGFALSCISFATVVQPQSRFRYLGDQRLGSLETYVLGFAQEPGATFTTTMWGTRGQEVHMLTQGILWVDKNGFQILRVLSDLLAPNAETGLDQETTEVTFDQVRLQDVPNPLWLPIDVNVYMEIKKEKYRNVHHYTNYRRYQVSVKIGAPQ